MFEQPKHLFVFLLFFCMTALVHPLPVNTTLLEQAGERSISRRWRYSSSSPDDVLLGFRYVDEWKARDYNQHETLTAIPASANMIGEGAYLSPVLDQYEKYKGYWECTVAGNSKSIKAASKVRHGQEREKYTLIVRIAAFHSHRRCQGLRTGGHSRLRPQETKGRHHHHLVLQTDVLLLSGVPNAYSAKISCHLV
ncbi:hypothetical protein F5880DRAFT_317187 [Lentinula raphanica]|nr:hypothetical protein F5880DRAFT_317187 [Lentinula raphanica]